MSPGTVSTMNRAVGILDSTVRELRELLAETARSGELDDVDALTALVRAVQQAANSVRPQAPSSKGVEMEEVEMVESTYPASTPRPRGGYPKFHVEHDTLVKSAWSKTKGSEYEHRAPVAQVEAVVNTVRDIVRTKAVFTADEVHKRIEVTDDEVPSYQIYLALAWLRSIGILGRSGRANFVIKDQLSLSKPIDTLLESTTVEDQEPGSV